MIVSYLVSTMVLITVASVNGENLRGNRQLLRPSIFHRLSHHSTPSTQPPSPATESSDGTISLNPATPNCINNVIGFDARVTSTSLQHVVATLSCANDKSTFEAESCFPQENFDASTGGFTCGTLGSPTTYNSVLFRLSGLTGERATCAMELVERHKDDNGNVVRRSLVSSTVDIGECIR